MLDMGFIHDIRKIVGKLPAARQTLLFSATMPTDIAELARQMLNDPAKVSVTPASTTVERIAQRIVHIDRAGKTGMLSEILRQEPVDRVLVFTRTKHGADKVVRGLNKDGFTAEAIHGNKSQNQRQRVLDNFRSGRVRTLVATDIAARGIDVEGVSHVINFDLPNIPESYVHRIGRTARAGADGVAISLCSHDELPYLRDIEKLIRMAIPATGQISRPAQQRPQPQQGRNGRPQNGQHRNGKNRNGQGHDGRARNGESRNNANGAARSERPAQRPHNPNANRHPQNRQQRQDQRHVQHDRRPAGEVGNDFARVAFMQPR